MRARGHRQPAGTGASWRMRLAGGLAVLLLGAALLVDPASSAAAPPSAAARLTIHAVALPSHFSSADESDVYEVLITNVGAAATETSSERPLTIRVADVQGMELGHISANEWGGIHEYLECDSETAVCVATRPIAPDEAIHLRVVIKAKAAATSATAEIEVEEEGAILASEALDTPISSEQAPFAIESFAFTPTGVDGRPNTEAGAHLYEQTTTFDFQNNVVEGAEEELYRPSRNPKTVAVTLPNGFVGNPLAAARCPVHALEGRNIVEGEIVPACPRDSRIGFASLFTGRSRGAVGTYAAEGTMSAVYNLTPEAGHPAEFGFNYEGFVVIFYADLIFSDGVYKVRVSVPSTPIVDLDGVVLTLFGDPQTRDGEPGASPAFLTNPSACSSQPAGAELQVDSWEEPNNWLSEEAPAYTELAGCDLLAFTPQATVTPEAQPGNGVADSVLGDSPDGYEVALRVPRAETTWETLPSPEIKDATVELPPGVSLSPSAANGLVGCPASGPEGIDLPHGAAHPDEAGEGEAIGSDGLSELAPGHCPPGSKVGEVEIETPLLEHALTGSLYLAQPECGTGGAACTPAQAEDGELVSVYLEAAGSGVVVKLEGRVEIGGEGTRSRTSGLARGQLRATFTNNPQLPVSTIRVKLDGGPRAPLESSQACGSEGAIADIEPWTGAGGSVSLTSSFSVVGCAAAEPLNPSFKAGTTVPTAAGSSPFTVTVGRRDGEQNLSVISVTTPPGISAILAGVPRCQAAQAAANACSAASAIGHVRVTVGVGSEPYLEEGLVYLTGPHNGAPFGLAIAVPAKAGPFNLGYVVVLASLNIDKYTGAVTATTDPLPQMLDGVPLRIKTASVSLDRAGFMLDPTNCSQMAVQGAVTGLLPDGATGSTAAVDSPYDTVGCRGLAFGPTITASTSAHASRVDGASLRVKVTAPAHQANIGKVKVDLPAALPSRDSTLKLACAAAVFESNPASCPAGADVGTATARTPLLAGALTGPAYLVSHGGEAFPDLDIVLQGEGVTIILTSNTKISHGITSSAFRTLPDDPISSFELRLPEGPHSILGAYLRGKKPYDFCGRKLLMPNIFTGQNGAQIKRTTTIAVTGCPKPKHKAKRSARSSRRSRRETPSGHR